MSNRIKFNRDHVVLANRVHAAGDVIEVSDEQYERLVKNEKAAEETDDELTVFPEPSPEAAVEIPGQTPDGTPGGVKAMVKPGTRR
jgi:hypothetical protein